MVSSSKHHCTAIRASDSPATLGPLSWSPNARKGRPSSKVHIAIQWATKGGPSGERVSSSQQPARARTWSRSASLLCGLCALSLQNKEQQEDRNRSLLQRGGGEAERGESSSREHFFAAGANSRAFSRSTGGRRLSSFAPLTPSPHHSPPIARAQKLVSRTRRHTYTRLLLLSVLLRSVGAGFAL